MFKIHLVFWFSHHVETNIRHGNLRIWISFCEYSGKKSVIEASELFLDILCTSGGMRCYFRETGNGGLPSLQRSTKKEKKKNPPANRQKWC